MNVLPASRNHLAVAWRGLKLRASGDPLSLLLIAAVAILLILLGERAAGFVVLASAISTSA